jgi:bifunctional NMN adenylyltransferase/nudix hydrolase
VAVKCRLLPSTINRLPNYCPSYRRVQTKNKKELIIMSRQTTPNTTTTDDIADLAVIIGRWQLLSKDGHERLFERAFQVGKRVLIVIGSAYRSRNTRNPFNWTERRDMILAALTLEQRERVAFLPVRDYYDDERWNDVVRTGVAQYAERGAKVTLVGWKKDRTSDYLDNFPGWTSTSVAPTVSIDATALREVFFGSTSLPAALTVLTAYVSSPVLAYLEAWSHLPVYAERVAEHRAVSEYKAKWGAGPFLTADSIVEASDHVLLVRRAGKIGYNLWALPGGHVEPWEQFYPAAVRELREETGFSKLPVTMRAALKETHVFDHALRSPRARVVTMAHFFDFGDMPLPDDLKAADDAMELKWFHKSELAALAEAGQLFEDHDVVLDKKYGFLPG